VGFHIHHKATKAQPGRLRELLTHYTMPVLIEFAERDSPACRMEEPVLSKVLRHFPDRLAVIQADTQASPEDAERFGVAAVPTFLLLVDGKERMRLVGFQTADQLIKAIEDALGAAAS
jgi:thioredoxin 1